MAGPHRPAVPLPTPRRRRHMQRLIARHDVTLLPRILEPEIRYPTKDVCCARPVDRDGIVGRGTADDLGDAEMRDPARLDGDDVVRAAVSKLGRGGRGRGRSLGQLGDLLDGRVGVALPVGAAAYEYWGQRGQLRNSHRPQSGFRPTGEDARKGLAGATLGLWTCRGGYG